MKKIDFKKTILSLCLVLTCLFVVAGVSAADNSAVGDISNDFNFDTYSWVFFPFLPVNLDIDAGTPYYWTFDSDASYGVELLNQSTFNHNSSDCGGKVTEHFLFRVCDGAIDHYLAKLNLIDCRTGEIVDSKILKN